MPIIPANNVPHSEFPMNASTPPTNEDTILLNWIRTEFNLTKDQISACERAFLRVFDTGYVKESIQEGVFHARYDDWIVHFQSTPEVIWASSKVGCSFREYKGKKYVVLKVWKEKLEVVNKESGVSSNTNKEKE